MKERGLSFTDCAHPDHFETDPTFAWGFYGHRSHAEAAYYLITLTLTLTLGLIIR